MNKKGDESEDSLLIMSMILVITMLKRWLWIGHPVDQVEWPNPSARNACMVAQPETQHDILKNL